MRSKKVQIDASHIIVAGSSLCCIDQFPEMPSTHLDPRHVNPFWLSFRCHILRLDVLYERCANRYDNMVSHTSSCRARRHIQSYPQFHFLAPDCAGLQRKGTEPRNAWICISTSIRRVHVKPDDITHRKSFLSFAASSVWRCRASMNLQHEKVSKGMSTRLKTISDTRLFFLTNSRVAIYDSS